MEEAVYDLNYQGAKLARAALDRATAEARRLETERSRLEVEKRAEATSLRVEKLAKDKLAMRTVTPAINHPPGPEMLSVMKVRNA